jgi:hypothetical protein
VPIPTVKEETQSQDYAASAEDGDDDDEDEELADGDLAAVQAGFMEPCKLVRLLLVAIAYVFNKRVVLVLSRFWLSEQI